MPQARWRCLNFPDTGQQARLLVELATAEYRAGQLAASLRHAEGAADLADRSGQPELAAAAALVVRGVGHPNVAIRLLRLCDQALAAGDRCPDATRARLLAQRWAEALRSRAAPGDSAEALVLAGQAAAETRRLDMPGHCVRASELVRQLRRAAAAEDPLTRREHEIAELVSAGLTNRAIAGQLVLSERTVEGHVRNMLAKLQLASRTELAAWALRGAPRLPDIAEAPALAWRRSRLCRGDRDFWDAAAAG